MTDTYDKENHWYGWNGGECPVHPETLVDTVDDCGEMWIGKAGTADWQHKDDPDFQNIIAFRITKLYREPRKAREWWAIEYADGSFGQMYPYPGKSNLPTSKVVHVREVLGDDDAH
jgi:hypothetical protein